MAFTWTSITAGTTKLEKAQITEVVNNIKTVENKLQLGTLAPGSKYTWTAGYYPFSLESVTTSTSSILREAVDNLHNNNYCKQHCPQHYVGHCGSNYPAEKSPHYIPNLTSHNSGYRSGHNNFN